MVIKISQLVDVSENNTLKEFEERLTKYKPKKVVVVWKGVYTRQYWCDDTLTYLCNEYFSIVSVEIRGKIFSIKIPSGKIAADTPDGFENILTKHGYEFVKRWGTVGHWNYLYKRPKQIKE